MEAIASLKNAYADVSDDDVSSSSDTEDKTQNEDEMLHLKPLSDNKMLSMSVVSAAPDVITTVNNFISSV